MLQCTSCKANFEFIVPLTETGREFIDLAKCTLQSKGKHLAWPINLPILSLSDSLRSFSLLRLTKTDRSLNGRRFRHSRTLTLRWASVYLWVAWGGKEKSVNQTCNSGRLRNLCVAATPAVLTDCGLVLLLIMQVSRNTAKSCASEECTVALTKEALVYITSGGLIFCSSPGERLRSGQRRTLLRQRSSRKKRRQPLY